MSLTLLYVYEKGFIGGEKKSSILFEYIVQVVTISTKV